MADDQGNGTGGDGLGADPSAHPYPEPEFRVHGNSFPMLTISAIPLRWYWLAYVILWFLTRVGKFDELRAMHGFGLDRLTQNIQPSRWDHKVHKFRNDRLMFIRCFQTTPASAVGLDEKESTSLGCNAREFFEHIGRRRNPFALQIWTSNEHRPELS